MPCLGTVLKPQASGKLQSGHVPACPPRCKATRPLSQEATVAPPGSGSWMAAQRAVALFCFAQALTQELHPKKAGCAAAGPAWGATSGWTAGVQQPSASCHQSTSTWEQEAETATPEENLPGEKAPGKREEQTKARVRTRWPWHRSRALGLGEPRPAQGGTKVARCPTGATSGTARRSHQAPPGCSILTPLALPPWPRRLPLPARRLSPSASACLFPTAALPSLFC